MILEAVFLHRPRPRTRPSSSKYRNCSPRFSDSRGRGRGTKDEDDSHKSDSIVSDQKPAYRDYDQHQGLLVKFKVPAIRMVCQCIAEGSADEFEHIFCSG